MSTADTHGVVVVGAGLAGWTLLRELRKQDPQRKLTLVSADSADFYAKPTLSNAYAQKRSPEQLVTTPVARMAEPLGVTVLPHTRVHAIDAAARQLVCDSGTLAFDQLVLATGAQAIRVPIGGTAADQVVSVNSLDDYRILHARLAAVQHACDRPARVLLLGAGLIGCEFANDLAASGMPVSVVDLATRPLAALLPEAASTEMQQALAALGVQWHLGTSVASVDHSAAGPAGAPTDAQATGDSALVITLANGLKLSADLVLSAVGLRPDLRLAQAAGLHCERGVVVNQHLQTSAAGIYALGDAAQYPHMGCLPYVMPIMHAAKVLASHLAGGAAELAFGAMPVAVKTPALPCSVLPPSAAMVAAETAAGGSQTAGWTLAAPHEWHWRDHAGLLRGFALTGPATSQRSRLSALLGS